MTPAEGETLLDTLAATISYLHDTGRLLRQAVDHHAAVAVAIAPLTVPARVMPKRRLNDRVRDRLRAEMKRQGFSSRECAERLQWSQSRVAKRLTGRVELSVDDFHAFCRLLQLRPENVVDDEGVE